MHCRGGSPMSYSIPLLMARSRNFARTRCERRKVISKKEIKSKHRSKNLPTRLHVHALSLRDTYTLINSGEVQKKELELGWQLELYKRFRTVMKTEDEQKRLFFRDALFAADGQGIDCRNHAAITMICNMAMHCEHAIRPTRQWKVTAPGHLGNSSLYDFISHCFALYEVPAFLHRVWAYRSMKLHREWFLQVGQGASLRALEAVPIPISKKMAQMLRQAPRDLTVDSSFRWAQARAMGASELLTGALLHTYLGRNKFRNDAYWQEVIRWMILVDIAPQNVHEIVDYLTHELYYNAQIEMKGRTLSSVTRLSEAWHLQAQQQYQAQYAPVDLDWDRYTLDDVTLNGDAVLARDAVVVQLCSSAELRGESQTMRHCVSTYAYRCSRAESVIFSLRWSDSNPAESPMATIEMVPSTRTLVQIRSVANASPDPHAMALIERWARQVGFRIGGR